MNEWSKEDLEEMFGDDIIEQLAFLSGCHQHQLCNSNPSGWTITDESLPKFAELIVKECIKVIETNHPEFDCKESADNLIRRAGRMDAMDEISKHFEVEE